MITSNERSAVEAINESAVRRSQSDDFEPNRTLSQAALAQRYAQFDMWEERAWSRHEDREMVFRVRASSQNRHWDGFEAILYEASPGYSEQQFARHNVSMQVGRPLLVTSRCDGNSVRRLQTPGDLKIVPPRIPRVWETESATIKLSMYLSPSLLGAAAEAMGLDADGVEIAPQLHLRDPRIEHIAWAVKSEIESPEPIGRLYGESLGLALAAQLVGRHARTNPERGVARIGQRRLARVLDYIAEHLAQDLSLAELAGIAGVSPSHFKVIFKRSLGVPVHQYVVAQRVRYATELILGERLSLSQIALQAGFANQSHMARCVKRIAGVAPHALRT